jgi:predicted NBD/HSP70 family sugar kinase
VRRHNLASVLRLVHARGSITRTELARETGLNRSTVAAIVSDLERRDLVHESPPDGPRGVGRPSFVITPSDAFVAVAVNPEVDAVTIGVIAMGQRVLRRVRLENTHSPTAQEVVNVVSALLAGMASELEGGRRTLGVGLAVPGLVRDHDGLIEMAPHLQWRSVRLADLLRDTTGLRVAAANDATCGAVAERLYGAGRGVDDVVFLNGGASGIGGGVIIDGAVLTGSSGYAGELGHTLVNTEGSECHCGAVGCLETEVRRSALLAVLGLPDAHADLLPERLTAEFADGRPRAAVVAEVERQVSFLAVALRNVINVFNPRLIVLGGFLGALHAVASDRLDRISRTAAMRGARDGVEIVAATLGRDSLLIGAGELVFAEILEDPTSLPEVRAEDVPRTASR